MNQKPEPNNQPHINSEDRSTESHGAHAGTRSGSSDYNDGGHTTHYLGNDDYDGNLITDDFSQEGGEDRVGQVANGNDVHEEEMLDEEGLESFPASDPPGHYSKSQVDREAH